MNKKKLLDLIGPAFLCHEINCKPIEQIASDLADNIMKAYEQPGTPAPTVDEDKLWMQAAEIITGYNIGKKNTTTKHSLNNRIDILKQQFSITRK